MKQFLLFIFTCISALSYSCGPYFPPSYLRSYADCFDDNINLPEELGLIAREYNLIDYKWFPRGDVDIETAERQDFTTASSQQDDGGLTETYLAYAKAIRAGDYTQFPPAVSARQQEFILYLEGVKELKASPDILTPASWLTLLNLPSSNRLYRTTWTYYTLGNQASRHHKPDLATEYYKACRRTTRGGMRDTLNLAHATYKREYLSQTNLISRIEKGIKAVGYYHQARDYQLSQFCLEHLTEDIVKTKDSDLSEYPMHCLEAIALFNAENNNFIHFIKNVPPLKMTPRLAWFMYENGDIEKATDCLRHCPDDDVLANWLRFRTAQRSGDTQSAIEHLSRWLNRIQQSKRIIFEFNYHGAVSPNSATHGALGTLYASQGQMMDAMIAFVQGGAYQDAALIAERYLETDQLKAYIDTFFHRPPYSEPDEYLSHLSSVETRENTVQLRLAYVLARRLFREDRSEEALPYYPPEIANIVKTYESALSKGKKFWLSPNVRSAHLYHAARLLRWKGMEMCGTELAPDYTINNGYFSWYPSGESTISTNDTPMYDDTAPTPDLRFHYRHNAAELAGQAAKLASNRHQKAMIYWSAGKWIQNRHPIEADVYYKKLAKIHFQPLAQAADQKRWFPEATPLMDYVFRNEEYVEPKMLSKAVHQFTGEAD